MGLAVDHAIHSLVTTQSRDVDVPASQEVMRRLLTVGLYTGEYAWCSVIGKRITGCVFADLALIKTSHARRIEVDGLVSYQSLRISQR